MPEAAPDWSKAVVSSEKLVYYLLDLNHPEGGPKAAFFRRCGFEPTRYNDLQAALLAQAARAEVTSVSSPYGVKYVAEGPILGVDGIVRQIRSVWIIEPGQDGPRFVTAYPMEANDGDR